MASEESAEGGFRTPELALAAGVAIPSGFGVAYYTLPPAVHVYWPLFGVFGSVVSFFIFMSVRGEWP